jgi:hypothetical protein
MSNLALVPVKKPVIVVARPHPLSLEKVSASPEHGLTLAQIVGEHALNCRIDVGSVPIPEWMWSHVRPKPGAIVYVTRYPQGGGGGGWKMILRLVAFAALAVLTYGIATGVAWLPEAIQGLSMAASAALAGVVGIGGSLLINALCPPAATGVGKQTTPTALQGINGVQNSMDPYGAITCVMGTMLLFPKLASRSYTELTGDDQYVRALFDLGYGVLETAQPKLGTDDLGNYNNVEYEIGPQPDLFPQDVYEAAASAELDNDGAIAIHATGENADEGSIDLIFGNGLFAADTSGTNVTATVKVKIEFDLEGDSSPSGEIVYIPVLDTGQFAGPISATVSISGDGSGAVGVVQCGIIGSYGPNQFIYGVYRIDMVNRGSGYTHATATLAISGGSQSRAPVIGTPSIATTPTGLWTNIFDLPGVTITNIGATSDGTYLVCASSERKAFRVGVYWKFPSRGLYKIRVTRSSSTWSGAPENNQSGNLTWTVLRTLRYAAPSTTPTTKLAMRIKATDQLNGTVSQFNLLVAQVIPVWTGAAWVDQMSSNPAWLFRWVLRDCPGNPRRVDPSRINDDDLKEWGAECDAKGFSFNYTNDQVTTVFELLKIICACGRASFTVVDSKYSIVRDVAQTVPVQVFSPRNTSSFQGSRGFVDVVHGLRVQFINPQAGYQQDELLVYDDGYDSTNASKFEQLQIPGCSDAAMAWKLGRYHLAVSRLRANTYSWNTDIEHLICNRGDLILFASDVISVGLGWGRVKGIRLDPATGNVTAVTVDEPQTITDFTRTYAIRFRTQIGSAPVCVVTFEPDALVSTFRLAVSTGGINIGDLFLFGVSGQDSIPMIVNRIEPTTDLAAKITAIDAAPDVLLADASYIDSTGTVNFGLPPLVSSITGNLWSTTITPPGFTPVSPDGDTTIITA